MAKLLELKGYAGTWDRARTVTASELVCNGLNSEDYDKSDNNVNDQACRIDTNREAFGRLVEQLHAVGVLTGVAVAIIADIDPDSVRAKR